METDVLKERKFQDGFVKYTNDLFFHHLLLNNEEIRNMICQQLVPDRKIISTKVRNEKQYGKTYREKKLILDILAEDDQNVLYNVEMQTYDMTIDIIIRTQFYGAEILRRQLNIGDNYNEAKDIRQMVINAARPLKGCKHYRHDFVMYDKKYRVDFPNNKIYITLIQLRYIEQVIKEMSVFDQLMYLFQNNKVYDKIKTDRIVKEAVKMHKEYISSKENYEEYWNRLDNQLLINAKIKQAKKATEELERISQEYNRISYEKDKLNDEKNKLNDEKNKLNDEKNKLNDENNKLSYEKNKLSDEKNKLSDENKKLHEEKLMYKQRIRNNINQYIQLKFNEDISKWLENLNEEQLFIIQDHLYIVNSIEELMKIL